MGVSLSLNPSWVKAGRSLLAKAITVLCSIEIVKNLLLDQAVHSSETGNTLLLLPPVAFRDVLQPLFSLPIDPTPDLVPFL